MNCLLEDTSVVQSSNFVEFIHRASRICIGQSAKAPKRQSSGWDVEANLSFED